MPASSLASASAVTATAWKSYASPKQADLAGPAEIGGSDAIAELQHVQTVDGRD
ncbi:hypothetical protein BFJ69_g15852 [Fusarium oxysporum]|uniref:Uncharacterized protein n=1 Tax=Fusarium oxysporum TaxID=5507 RepID=A0A420MD13_FUSOX|nr:hypothetical protein BFJ69_g15852 [Fusarium oxysporum]